MRQQLLFKLDQDPAGRGLRCDSDGLFLGRDALLRRDSGGKFAARPAAELQNILGRAYGGEADWGSRVRSVDLVAKALNSGDMARATMTAVLMRLPDPGEPFRIAGADGGLVKAGFNPDEPRDEQGRWTDEGDTDSESKTTMRDPRTQLAEDGGSDASDDPVAQAAAQAAAIGSRHDSERIAARDKSLASSDVGSANSWITRYRNLWAAIVAFFGNPQNTTHTVDDAHELASKILGNHLSKMRGVKAIYYHRALSTITNGQIQSSRLPDITVVLEDKSVHPYEILSPNQKARDLMNKYIGIQPNRGSQFKLADPQVMSVEEVMALPEAAPIAAEDAEAQAAIAAQEEAEEAITFGGP